MKKLILHPTDTCQWHALVNEAQAATNMVLDENTESYLVFLLMRFSQKTHLIESVIALDFLESMHCSGKRQVSLLQEVGDKSLLFCGLFPGMASRRHVSLDYFVELGKSAYLTIGELEEKGLSHLYYQLSAQFPTMLNVLQAMRSDYVNDITHDSCIIAAADLPLQ